MSPITRMSLRSSQHRKQKQILLRLAPPLRVWSARSGAHLLPDLGIGSNVDAVRIERTTSDDFSGVSFAGAWPFSGLLLLASRFCNLLDDHRWAIGKLGDQVELPTHRFDIAFEG